MHRNRRAAHRRALRFETLCLRRLLAADLAIGFETLSLDAWLVKSAQEPVTYGPLIAPEQQGELNLDARSYDEYVRVDRYGLEYAWKPAFEGWLEDGIEPQGADGEGDGGGGGMGGGDSGGGGSDGGLLPPESSLVVPIFHSKPNAPKKIYLDFDGEKVSGTFWNNQNYTGSYNTGPVIDAPAFTMDGDRTTFNESELTVIREVWARMAEDFAPFQVDVTTEYPGPEIFLQGNQAIRVMISTDIDATTGTQWFPTSGGVAYLNSWSFTNGTPVWVFYNRLGGGNAKNLAEAGSHEVGHAFNLRHDGRTSPSEGYYGGHGSGQTGWAPIMGVGYYRALSQWSRGEYASANNTEDDIAILSSKIPFEPDDHGDSQSTATELIPDALGNFSVNGLISTRTDVDAFTFFAYAGQVSLEVAPFEVSTGKANLDAEMTILNSLGQTIAIVNPTTLVGATWSAELAQGVYTVLIDGVGKAAVTGDPGYSDYGSLGWYTLIGTVPVAPEENYDPVVLVNAANVGGDEGTIIVNSGTWSDANASDSVVLSASVGTVSQYADGTWMWSFDAEDQLAETQVTITAEDGVGGVGTASFTFTVANVPPVLSVAQASVVGNVLSVLNNSGTWSDVPADTVTLSASLGSVALQPDGTWVWSYTSPVQLQNETVVITAMDEDGGVSDISFDISAVVVALNGGVFYRNSEFERLGGLLSAIDGSRSLLRAGSTSQVTTSTNVTSYSRGINGVLLEVAGLEAGSLTTSDFIFRVAPPGAFGAVTPSTWPIAPDPESIEILPRSNDMPARVKIGWKDNAIENTWLQIIVLANSNTQLAERATYYVGHVLGDVDFSGPSYRITTIDVSLVQSAVANQLVGASEVRDVDKDRRVTTMDLALVRSLVSNSVRLRTITVPAAGSGAEGEGDGGAGLLAAPLPASGGSASLATTVSKPREILPRFTQRNYDVLPAAASPDVAPKVGMQNPSQEGVRVVQSRDWHSLELLDDYFSCLTKEL